MRNAKYNQGEQIREEIILLCVQWYVLYNLSYSQLQMVMQQRGFKIDPRTFNYLVTEYYLPAKKRIQETKRRRKTGWRVVQIPFKLNGRKKYLYRAVDAQSNTLDFFIASNRSKEKAKNFFQQTISQTSGLKAEVLQNKPKKTRKNYLNWLWGFVIIILLFIGGKLIFDQVEKLPNIKRENQNSQSNSELLIAKLIFAYPQ